MASLCGGEGRREGGGSLTLGLKLFSERLMVLGGSSQRVRPASRRKEKPPFRLDLCTLGSQPVYSVPLHWAHLSPATPRLGRSHEPCFEGEVQRSWRDTHGTSPLPPASLPALILAPSSTQSGYLSAVDSGTRLFTKLTRQR